MIFWTHLPLKIHKGVLPQIVFNIAKIRATSNIVPPLESEQQPLNLLYCDIITGGEKMN